MLPTPARSNRRLHRGWRSGRTGGCHCRAPQRASRDRGRSGAASHRQSLRRGPHARRTGGITRSSASPSIRRMAGFFAAFAFASRAVPWRPSFPMRTAWECGASACIACWSGTPRNWESASVGAPASRASTATSVVVNGRTLRCRWIVGADGQNSVDSRVGRARFRPVVFAALRLPPPLSRSAVDGSCRGALGRSMPGLRHSGGRR